MVCPICKKQLEQTILSGAEVDYCPKCFGLWFEQDELRLAKDYKESTLRWLDVDLWREPEKFKISTGQKLCPWCRLPLYETDYGDSGIKLDVCNICQGIWLDRGEFKKIIEYLKKKIDHEALKHYLKNLREELWEIFAGPENLKEEIDDFLMILKVLNYKFIAQHPHIAKIISSLPK